MLLAISSEKSMRTLARLGLILVMVFLAFGLLAELFRLYIEFSESLLNYVPQDAAIALACAAGIAVCYVKCRRIERAQAAEMPAIVHHEYRPEFNGSRLEAKVNLVIMIPLLLRLVVTAIPFVLGAWLRPGVGQICSAVLYLAATVYTVSSMLRYWRPGKPTLVLDANSFDHAWYGPIRWDQIHGISCFQLRQSDRNSDIRLGVAKPGRYLRQLPWAMRIFVSRERMDADIGVLRIPMHLLNQPTMLIHKAALSLRSRVSPPLLKFWTPRMTAGQMALINQQEATLARMEQISASLKPDAPITSDQNHELLRLSEDLRLQSAANRPFLQRDLARVQRMKYALYALFGLFVLFCLLVILVVVWRAIQHAH